MMPPQSSRKLLAVRLKRFALLWWKFFGLVLLVAAVEGIALWIGGFKYKPRSSVEMVWASDISFDRYGHTAAALVNSIYTADRGRKRDVVLIDLERQATEHCELGYLEPQCVAVHPDGHALVVASGDGSIYAIDLSASSRHAKRKFARTSQRHILSVCYAPNGKLLAAIDEFEVSVWSWPEGQIVQRFRYSDSADSTLGARPGASDFIRFSSDSEYILTPYAEATLAFTQVTGGANAPRLVFHGGSYLNATLAHQSELVAVTTNSGVSVHPLGSQHPSWQLRCIAPAVALDQRQTRLAVARNDHTGRIEIRELATGDEVSVLDGNFAFTIGLQFAGKKLYSWDASGQLRAWDTQKEELLWSISLSD